MVNSPVVSVIMPVFNSVEYIEEAIRSVQQQTFTDWELIIVDDASLEPTVPMVERWCGKDTRIALLKHPVNKGAGAARNTGISAARGRYVAFLDADDLWLPEKLRRQLDFLQHHGQAVGFSSYYLMDERGRTLNTFMEALPELTFSKLLKSNYIGNLTGIYDSGTIGKIYAPVLRKRQDWALWLQVLDRTGPVKGILEPLAIYRIHKSSLSKNKAALLVHNFKIYREVLRYGFWKSCKFLGIFLWEHFFVKKKQLKPRR